MGKRGPRIHEFRQTHPWGVYSGEVILQTGLGRYYLGIQDSTSAAVFSNATIGRLWASPFPVSRAVEIDELACQVTTAQATSNVRLGLYKSNAAGAPGALIADSGALDSSTTGSKTAAVSAFLEPGVYWTAWEYDTASVGLRGRGGTAGLSLGFPNTGNEPYGILFGNHTFGALPDPFPTIQNYFTLNTVAGHVVYVRVV